MAYREIASGASQSASKPGVYGEFWDMPSRFWRPRVRELEEAEMEAITVRDSNPLRCSYHLTVAQSGGASLAQ
jgi:hypothetical protein